MEAAATMNGVEVSDGLAAETSGSLADMHADRSVTLTMNDDASSKFFLSSAQKTSSVPVAAPPPASAFVPPALVRTSRATSRTPALRHHMVGPATLLGEVWKDPLFQLLPSAAHASSATTAFTSRQGSLLSSAVASSRDGTTTPPFIARTSAIAREEVEPHAAPEPPLVLPSSHAAPPTMLLVALADMDVLQHSFYAHTCVWPAKEQVGEFKKLVAASMRAELTQGTGNGSGSDGGGGARSGHLFTLAVTGSGDSPSTHNELPHHSEAAEQDESTRRAKAAAAAAGAHQAHDAAVRAALHSAHGFLFGPETVPNGVPKAHLQRARLQWVSQYEHMYVRPRLEQAQRHRYEFWRLQQQQQQQQSRRGVLVEPRRKTTTTVPRMFSLSLASPATVPALTCAAVRPDYWRTGSVDATSGGAGAGADSAVLGSTLLSAATRRRGFLPGGMAASNGPTAAVAAEAKAMTAAWEWDLYDDLRLVVTTQLSHSAEDQTTSRSAVEAAELTSTTAAAAASADPATAAAAANVLRSPSDLTQMQLPLPVFVYVMSRYLFLAHYAAYFPPGLFSSALINPFYFPEPAQCTAAYALRAVPAVRREAEAVCADYAAQLRDAHNCFPDRVPYMEVPLPPHDVLHLWELLCPPQEQDRIGRWLPVPWGHLAPEEEEALLEREYADATTAAAAAAAVGGAGRERPLLAYGYARAARRQYRHRLQQLAMHPTVLDEVERLMAVCETVAMRFFLTVDTEQRGCISWEDFTSALIEEADIQDHQLKVREHAAQLTRASASVFDRYVVEPLAPALVRLGYTGAVFAVRHSASLVMIEGATDYAVCDGTQLGSIHQRFLVRPVEVVLKELEAVPRDAFGRPLRYASAFADRDDDDDDDALTSAGGGRPTASGYDAALRQHPWRNNQQPVRSFVRYEDGRRLQESTALTVLQQLSGASPDDDESGSGAAAASAAAAGGGDDSAGAKSGAAAGPARMHQPAKPVVLQAVMAVEDVSPYVPWTVFVAASNDLLLRLYSSNRAVQALPEAGLLRCAETVTCMEWAAGGSRGRATVTPTPAPAAAGNSAADVSAATAERRGGGPAAAASARRAASRLAVQAQEYIILGTRSGQLCVVDLYAVLHRVPRLSTAPVAGTSAGKDGHAAHEQTAASGGGSAASGPGGGRATSERIGSSSNAWSGYKALAQRTYYNEIDPFVVHRRQVHTRGTVVSSVVAAASNGLFVSSGLDGDVFTLRLGYPTDAAAAARSAARGTVSAMRAGVTTINADGTTTTIAERPVLCIEVLQRLTVCETGVRYALPIPSLSMMAVQTVANKVYLYHTSVLPTAAPLIDGGRPEASASPKAGAPFAATESTPAASPATASRLELYDAAAPHLGTMVAVMAVEELDQLLTVDSTGYVKVWSLRQTQPLTSFYAIAPVQETRVFDSPAAPGVAGDGQSGAPDAASTPARPSSTPDGDRDGKGLVSSLLRTTKHSIEAAVDAAGSRLQVCLSAAYNYAGRQLYVMGSNNAALCFFMSGQSSARAHTNPLRVLLVDAACGGRGQAHRRLITLSSADCRVWSLRSGAMALGIRASNAEYRQLFDHRLTGRPDSGTQRERKGDATSAAAKRADGRPMRAPAAATEAAALTASALTTGEAGRQLPRSVEDVMRAVAARPGSTRRRGHAARTAVAADSAVRQVGSAKAMGRAAAGGGDGLAAAFSGGMPGRAAGAGGEVEDGALPGALRDQNVLISDIRCACLGPEGQWIGYALLHGEIRLHRSDSGRLLHTFITTPPSMTELVQAALRYEHLFVLTAGAASPSSTANANAGTGDVAGLLSSSTLNASAPARPARTPAVPAASSRASHIPPRPKLTPAAYAQAVAVVLQRLLASTSAGQRFGSFSASSRANAVSAVSGAAGVLDNGGRDVHREPLSMFFVEASQELVVVYADGLVRVFTLLGHRTTATRVIVSRTLVNRALEQVRRVLRQQSTSSTSRAGAVVADRVPLEDLLMTGGPASAGFAAADVGHGGRAESRFASPSVHRRRASSLIAAAAAAAQPLERLSSAHGSMAESTGSPPEPLLSPSSLPLPRLLEPDVVLLATASPPLGLICLVHASGLVTVMDVQATSDATAQAGLGGDGDGPGRSVLAGASIATGTGAGGHGSSGDFSRSQAGVVVHSFTTKDEVTAAGFLGAYPCLVLADRQRVLSFHLVKGSSLLALVGDFAERLQRDLVRLHGWAAGSAASPRKAAAKTSATCFWTLSLDDTCASVHALGTVTALTFDPLYATLYVGTSQGYIMSYLLRRLLLAFQLTPVFLRGVDGVAVTTYAAELQRSLSRPAGPLAAKAAGMDSGGAASHFVVNFLHVLFHIEPRLVDRMATTKATDGGEGEPVESTADGKWDGGGDTTPTKQQATAEPTYHNRSSFLLQFYEAHPELFRLSSGTDSPSRRTGGSPEAAAALLAAFAQSSSNVLLAAAVLHDTVTRMHVAASAAVDEATHVAAAGGRSGFLDGQGSAPWWDAVCGGGLVREFIARQCGAAAAAAEAATTAAAGDDDALDGGPSAAERVGLMLNEEAAQLMRAWVRTAMPSSTPPPHLHTAQDSLESSVGTATLPPSSHVPSPLKSRAASSHRLGRSAKNAGGLSIRLPAQPLPSVDDPSPTTSPRTVADVLVREVEEELLFGDTAAFAAVAGDTTTTTTTTTTAPVQGPARGGPHPLTHAWVEPVFTRHAVAMASRSPICLLTPPAMLERARRERLDRLVRKRSASAPPVEWDHYVEGAPPDYLADMLSRPGQVLPEAERQALRQRAITALQCRRNGYLCVGHADGGVTLWTPYACGRLESLCPSTSLPASLDRLERSVQMQFQYLHERVVLERQRLAFEGAAHNVGRNEQEGKTHMKRRIRKMLLDHHLSQLHQDSAATGLPGREAAAANYALAPVVGTLEAQLLAMRPLMCLVLGIGSLAELHARQLALEDLCFLPLRMEGVASIEAFRAESYAAAVTVAVRRLQRELMDDADGACPLQRHFPADTSDDPRRGSRHRPSRSLSLAQPPRQPSSVQEDCACVYDVSLASLTRDLCGAPLHRPRAALVDFPGAVRLLLHRALEGATASAVHAPSTRVSVAHGAAVAASPFAGLSSATTLAAAGPVEGEFFDVCHSVQVAEVAAEAQWESRELRRLWTCLQHTEDAAAPQQHDGRARPRVGGSRQCTAAAEEEEAGAPLPPGSAAAVSAAVRRQLRRELEGRLAALSQRTPAGAALLPLGLRLGGDGGAGGGGMASSAKGNVALAAGEATIDEVPASHISSRVGYAFLTRGTGLAWVQASLRQQAAGAFAEPLLRLPAASPATKLRAAKTVSEARRGQARPHATATAASSLVLTKPVPVPAGPAEVVGTPEEKTEEAGPLRGIHAALSTSPSASPPSTPLGATVVPGADAPATTAAVFLTEMNVEAEGEQGAESSNNDKIVAATAAPLLSPADTSHPLAQQFPRFGGRGRGPVAALMNLPTAAASPRVAGSEEDRPDALASPYGLPIGQTRATAAMRGRPLVPLHRTKLARTGSCQPVRSRPATALAAETRPPVRAASASFTADSVQVSGRGGGERARVSSALLPPSQQQQLRQPPFSCYALMRKSGTTKQ